MEMELMLGVLLPALLATQVLVAAQLAGEPWLHILLLPEDPDHELLASDALVSDLRPEWNP